MVIILCLYVVALWLVFSKFKLVRWGWLSGTISLLVGGFILAAFLALFNYLTPSGTLVRTDALGATVLPAEISIPDGMNRDQLRLGMSGSPTAFVGNAGVIGLLASILVWIGCYTAYLWPAGRKMSGCSKKAHIFRLCCKIPIINLSEPARGFAKMKAVRWIGAE